MWERFGSYPILSYFCIQKAELKTTMMQNNNLITSLYNSYCDQLRRYFCSYLHDMQAAEDMTHDLFLKVMAIDTIQESTGKQLLFSMAHNMIIDDARHKAFVRRESERLHHEQQLCDNHTPARQLEGRQMLERVRQRIDAMPQRRASIFKMYREEELCAQEIADRLGISRRTVEVHIYQSTKEIRAYRKVL